MAQLGLDVLRIDFNIAPDAPWQSADRDGRDGMTQAKYIEGLYRLWDDVLASKPGLLIDNCASGGRRIDLETLSRSVPLWRSDSAQLAQPPEQQQVETMGLSGFAPVHAGTVAANTPYAWRSSGSVGVSVIFDLGEAISDPVGLAAVRAAQNETVRLRPLSIFGDFYPLTPVVLLDQSAATSCLVAWQHHCDGRPECGGPAVHGALHVFHRPSSPPVPAPGCPLYPYAVANTPRATFEVRWFFGWELNRTETMAASALAALHVDLPPNGSALVEYTCVSGC